MHVYTTAAIKSYPTRQILCLIDISIRLEHHAVYCRFKGTVARDVFYHSIVSRIESKDINFLFFVRTMAAFSIFGECAKIFLHLIGTP